MTRTFKVYALGLRAIKTGKFHLAEALLMRALVDDPDDPDAEVGLARAFLSNPGRPMAQRVEMALFHLCEALDRVPTHEDGLTLYLWCDRVETLLRAGVDVNVPVPAP